MPSSKGLMSVGISEIIWFLIRNSKLTAKIMSRIDRLYIAIEDLIKL